ncbi:DUF3179 domain-containing protein [Haloferax mediterranei ATCC 33500]|uniref:DUF3179 domain-containing protein n=1 Tax=Haloferax mediterranei (strain ATCC 33500 / DSM 1411 / JCM 8866 / NBRC 14739 / NCIMB 2177 / R-4) TaxID=523841 RepID=I3R2V0_HALMT|nr:DUF3179 domain-containing protein [Haloferax mediterranei]AFK18560.1 hypothetical protein HFX_0839 [Haloferax mediterranei ATCC 33500]AHZ22063.1 hypothetical protein BM92_05040 [Haloferax mediterranei ATCC 33500]EMA02164.1 hypothetical protein C439_06275 [Haloferax mediterranei ATCC 33500]MDX5988649.1 DUF3179 domain-containing protein [Haloferax mediterranei ATCC 33500]QCQ75062.1 DUF3179 domain-containing protein [Haloferax mediterranei ATCC 33500]
MNVRQVIPRDAIPSVEDPRFVETYSGPEDDEVISLTVGDDTRAYPIRYLHYHEIVNDTVGGIPVAVTWCPLCGSAVVYDRRVGDRTLEFGVSGKLADDDLVMYDRETESEWKQSLGEAIAGELAGESLTVLPAGVTTWDAFTDTNPDGRVMTPPGGESEAAGDGDDPEPIDYDLEPYEHYFEMDGYGLGAHRGTGGRDWDADLDDIDPKTVVVGLEHEGVAVGVPLPVVESASGVVTVDMRKESPDEDRHSVVVFATDAGIHAFSNPGFTFDSVGDSRTFRADGTDWDGATGVAEDGRKLDRVPACRLFAFAWRDDHGADAFYRR